LREMLF